jgi:hypothetical protein
MSSQVITPPNAANQRTGVGTERYRESINPTVALQATGTSGARQKSCQVPSDLGGSPSGERERVTPSAVMLDMLIHAGILYNFHDALRKPASVFPHRVGSESWPVPAPETSFRRVDLREVV